MNKWTFMKKLNVIMLLALVAAVSCFLVFKNARQYMNLFDRTMGAVAMAAFFLFLGILIFWVRRTAVYIRTLNEEIHALEGGDLTREITVQGDGEIAMLAESIDGFRKSMQDQLVTIEELEKYNRLNTEEIAHDLRTPLTSLMMYLDFAMSELGDREPQAVEYVTKARGRSVRLKTLLDENFSYKAMQDDPTVKFQKVTLYEALSGYLRDMMSYLESEGFFVRLDIIYGHSNILIIRDALGRVFGNLASNIMKYAAKDEEVLICCREKETHTEVRIMNRVRTFEGEKPESTGFGERIVRRLMEEMEGEYQSEEEDGKYSAILLFKKV